MLDSTIYLEKSDEPHIRPTRPIAPGDIFQEVPLAWVPKHKDPFEISAAKAPLRTVMIMGHPCSIYGGGRPATCLTIVEVRPKSAACSRPFEPPWDDFLYLFPLPRFQNEEDYVADFRRIGTAHFKYFDESRIACLNHDGWGYLHQRYMLHAGRIEIEFAESLDALEEYWNEFSLWERWNENRDRVAFQEWLDHECTMGKYSGTVRRSLLKFAADELFTELEAELG